MEVEEEQRHEDDVANAEEEEEEEEEEEDGEHEGSERSSQAALQNSVLRSSSEEANPYEMDEQTTDQSSSTMSDDADETEDAETSRVSRRLSYLSPWIFGMPDVHRSHARCLSESRSITVRQYWEVRECPRMEADLMQLSQFQGVNSRHRRRRMRIPREFKKSTNSVGSTSKVEYVEESDKSVYDDVKSGSRGPSLDSNVHIGSVDQRTTFTPPDAAWSDELNCDSRGSSEPSAGRSELLGESSARIDGTSCVDRSSVLVNAGVERQHSGDSSRRRRHDLDRSYSTLGLLTPPGVLDSGLDFKPLSVEEDASSPSESSAVEGGPSSDDDQSPRRHDVPDSESRCDLMPGFHNAIPREEVYSPFAVPAQLQSGRRAKHRPGRPRTHWKSAMQSKQMLRTGAEVDVFFRWTNCFPAEVCFWHFQLRQLVHAVSANEVMFLSRPGVAKILNTLTGSMRDFKLHLNNEFHGACFNVGKGLYGAGFSDSQTVVRALSDERLIFNRKISSHDILNYIEFYTPHGGQHEELDTRMLTSCNDRQLTEWALETGRRRWTTGFPHCVNHTALSPDQTIVCVSLDSKDVILLASDGRNVVDRLVGHSSDGFAAAWHPSGHLLATGNEDKTCRVWDIRLTKFPLVSFAEAVRQVEFSSDGRFLMFTESSSEVHVYDVASHFRRVQHLHGSREIPGACFSPSASKLWIGSASGISEYETGPPQPCILSTPVADRFCPPEVVETDRQYARRWKFITEPRGLSADV